RSPAPSRNLQRKMRISALSAARSQPPALRAAPDRGATQRRAEPQRRARFLALCAAGARTRGAVQQGTRAPALPAERSAADRRSAGAAEAQDTPPVHGADLPDQ